MSNFIYLPEDGASANDELARFHEEFLAAGNVGWIERADDMRWLMSHFLPPRPWKQNGTTCALYLKAAMMAAQLTPSVHVPPYRTPKEPYGITSWVQFYFGGAQWIPVAKIRSGESPIIRGDCPYWCGRDWDPKWSDDLDGHIACVTDGKGFMWRVAEGGGGLPRGTCKIGAAPRDISYSHQRPLRGVLRPNYMPIVTRGRRDPKSEKVTVPEGMRATEAPAFIPLKRGDISTRVGAVQLRLSGLGYSLPLTFRKGYADKSYGGETSLALEKFQAERGLPIDGDTVTEACWNALFTSNVNNARSGAT